jgi:hypothetical protein
VGQGAVKINHVLDGHVSLNITCMKRLYLNRCGQPSEHVTVGA